MASCLLFLSLLVGLASGFGVYQNCTYDTAVTTINNVLHSNFAKFIPAEVTEEMEDIVKTENKPELENLVRLHNQMMDGKIQTPHSREEVLSLLEEKAPATFIRVEGLWNDTLAKYETLSPAAKAYYDQAEQEWYNQSFTGPVQTRIAGQIQMFLEQNDKFLALPASVKAEFHERWPEIMNFVESPIYKSIVTILKSSNPKNLGTTVASMLAIWSNNQRPAVPAN